jgi:hypothetical protein
MIFSKVIWVLGAVASLLALVIISGVLIVDPPPFRLRDDDKVALSIERPRTIDPGFAGSIERGLACTRRLEVSTTGRFRRPEITLFDWFKRTSGSVPDPDYHLEASKPNDTWAIKVDRTKNKFCWLRPGEVQSGMSDSYCGPNVVREDATQIEALSDGKFGSAVAVVFDKRTYTVTLTTLDWVGSPASAEIDYLECN